MSKPQFIRKFFNLRLIKFKNIAKLLVIVIFVFNIFLLLTYFTNDTSSRYESNEKFHRTITNQRMPEDVEFYFSFEDLDEAVLVFQSGVHLNSEKCSDHLWNVPVAEDVKETFQWQTIAQNRSDIFVLSAFYDPRTRPRCIRIMALTTTTKYFKKGKNRVKYCQMWFTGRRKPLVVQAEYVYLPDGHESRYLIAIYNCYLDQDDAIPYAISMSLEPCQESTNLLKVISNSHTSIKLPLRNFTVCVSPINNNYNNVHQLVEMIEINRLFGAEHFVFYNYSVGSIVNQYLNYYIREGLVEVMPWHLPTNQSDVHYFAQLSALNDCLYREMFRSRFIIFTDLDEIIVPQVRENWHDLLRDAYIHWRKDLKFSGVDKNRLIYPGSFMFRNAFFYTDWDDDTSSSLASLLKLNTLLKTSRDATLNMFYARSKCIVWAKSVVQVSVHNVLLFINKSLVMNVQVDENLGTLHHYRQKLDNNHVKRKVDRRMHAFADRIVNAIKQIHRSIGVL